MKKSYVVICIALAMSMFSGCASFNNIREAEDFLAAEKAKNVTPVVKVYKSGYTIPMDSTGQWVAAGVAASPLVVVAAPLVVVGAAVGAQSGLMIAGKETKYEDLWYLTGANIQYGRFVMFHTNAWNEKGEKLYRYYTLELALKEVGPPAAPCVIAKHLSNQINNEGSNRFKATQKYVSDKEARRGILLSNKISFSIFYKTEIPAGESQAPAYCTKELAEEHFGKILEYMTNL